MPDLILIDGGIGQVNAVDSILKSLDLDIPIAGLAKRDEEIYRPGNSMPIRLPKRSDALRLLQRVRDETHRFATSRNQELRTKENTVSPFTKIRGIGPKRDALLMKKFGTLKSLAESNENEISETLKVPEEAAQEILVSAKNFSRAKRFASKQRLSIGAAGTTKEKAARSKLNENLASAALEVASPDDFS